jgi:hypothetical protein
MKMRIYVFFVILITGFALTITAAVKPHVFTEKYEEIRAPYDQYIQDQEAKKLQDEKEQARAAWMLKFQMPQECKDTTSAIKQLECSSERNQHMQQFEQQWRYKIAQGWKP